MYSFSPTTKQIKQTYDYLGRYIKPEINKDLRTQHLVDAFNYGLPLPPINFKPDCNRLFDDQSRCMANFINMLVNENSGLVVDLYIREIRHLELNEDDLYMIPTSMMFDSIKLLKYQRSLTDDQVKTILDCIDDMHHKLHHFPITVNEIYNSKKGVW